MANYVINNNKYNSLAFMVLADDTERERGNIEEAENMKKKCEINGWISILMKNDWETIYGENVKKKNSQFIKWISIIKLINLKS